MVLTSTPPNNTNKLSSSSEGGIVRSPSQLIIVFSLLLTALLPVHAFAESLIVTVKNTSIRTDHKFYAKNKATVSYGKSLTLISTKDDWYKVKYNNTTGWVHNSAVSLKSSSGKDKKNKSDKPSALSGLGKKFGLGAKKQESTKTAGYSQDDVTLAGKGFSEEVEKNYRKKNPKINYKDVDWIERQTASTKTSLQFAKAGHLTVREDLPQEKKSTASTGKKNKKQTDSKGESLFDKAKKNTSGFFGKLKLGGKKESDSGGAK